MQFKSFDIVAMVLEEANERFAPIFKPVEERVIILEQYCGAIDKLIADGDGTEFEIEVDEDDMTVHISFLVTDMIADNPRTDPLPQLIARASSVEMTPVDGENIRVNFVFPSLWERA